MRLHRKNAGRRSAGSARRRSAFMRRGSLSTISGCAVFVASVTMMTSMATMARSVAAWQGSPLHTTAARRHLFANKISILHGAQHSRQQTLIPSAAAVAAARLPWGASLFQTGTSSDAGGDNGIAAVSASTTASGTSTATTNRVPTNQEIVERRLDAIKEKRLARQQSSTQRRERNLHLKRLLHTQSGGADYAVPPLYAVKVWVADGFRDELKLTGREKRGRVFLERSKVQTFHDLKGEMHAFFRALRKDTYLLEASLPVVTEEGTILSPSEYDDDATESWPIRTDADVARAFRAADDLFQSNTTNLVRPSMVISVLENPDAPKPPPIPSYLVDLPDPQDAETMTMISFYSFPPNGGIDDPEQFAAQLRKTWKPFHALGRVYVAHEGVNAQMSIPSNVLDNFMECCRSIPELEHMENDINIDPKPLTMEEFAVAGVPNRGKPAPPFRNLHVRVRHQVVADGLDKSLDWQSAGYDMPPLEWHETLKQASQRANEKSGSNATASADALDAPPIVLDCRNTYETDVGIFDGAEPLNTDNFRDSWDVLKERLADTPKDAPIMTYCTGGIRCVKVGAYLTQEMGFTNVSRLAGGIIAYDRTVSQEVPDEESMFKGTNFVFDGRLGRSITDDSLAVCITCGGQTSLVSNCRNDNCHKRMVQCERCRTDFMGTCSDACRTRVINGAMAPRRGTPGGGVSGEEDDSQDLDSSSGETISTTTYDSIDDYSIGHSTSAPCLFSEMELNTRAFFPSGAHMVSGESQGRFLTQLTAMAREGRVLELGTFSGYATACFWEGARDAGAAMQTTGNKDHGPYILTMERDRRAFQLAHAQLKVIGEQGMEGAAKEMAALRDDPSSLPELQDTKITLPPLDGVAACDMWHVTDALATVEELAAGKGGDDQPAPFDIVFVDADKTRLLDYVEACLANDNVLKKGGMILVDNVLWKGLVLEASQGSFTSVADTHDAGKEELRKNRRARKLATQMHRFNEAIAKDERVDVQLFPIRDGLSMIRKK